MAKKTSAAPGAGSAEQPMTPLPRMQMMSVIMIQFCEAINGELFSLSLIIDIVRQPTDLTMLI